MLAAIGAASSRHIERESHKAAQAPNAKHRGDAPKRGHRHLREQSAHPHDRDGTLKVMSLVVPGRQPAHLMETGDPKLLRSADALSNGPVLTVRLRALRPPTYRSRALLRTERARAPALRRARRRTYPCTGAA